MSEWLTVTFYLEALIEEGTIDLGFDGISISCLNLIPSRVHKIFVSKKTRPELFLKGGTIIVISSLLNKLSKSD